jgi:hypothetical protein
MGKGQLLTETFSLKLQLLENDSGGRLVARGQFGKADIPTANRRVYPRSLWERELQKLLPKMKANEVYGELDHPADGMTKLSRVSHLVTNIDIQDDGLIIGEAVILPDTRNGKQLMAILKNGGKIGVSSRGFGSVVPDEQGNDVVQDDFQLMTWDFVADPAAAGSFPEFKTETKKAPPEVKLTEVKEEETMPVDKNKINEAFIAKTNEEDANGQGPIEGEGTPADSQTANEDEMAQDEIPSDKMEALIAQIRKEEAEKAVKKLGEMVKEMEDEIKGNIKSELMSDPEIAGAKIAMENVKKQLRPYILGEDISEEIGLREKQIEGLTNDIKSKEVQLKEYATLTKELGFKLRVEQKISDSPYKQEVRHSIGDVTRFSSLKELDVKIESVMDYIKKQQSRFESKEKQKDQVIVELETKVKDLDKMYKEAIKVAEGFGIKAYTVQKTMGHECSTQIQSIVEKRHCRTTDEVDALIEQFNSVKKTNSLSQRIKTRLAERKGPRPSSLVEDQIRATFPKESKGEEILPGITMDDVKKLSMLESDYY